MTEERDALQSELSRLCEEAKRLKEEKEADGYGGWSAIKEHDDFEEKIATKTQEDIARWRALIDAVEQKQAVIE